MTEDSIDFFSKLNENLIQMLKYESKNKKIRSNNQYNIISLTHLF